MTILLASLDILSYTVLAEQGWSGNTTTAEEGLSGNTTGITVS